MFLRSSSKFGPAALHNLQQAIQRFGQPVFPSFAPQAPPLTSLVRWLSSQLPGKQLLVVQPRTFSADQDQVLQEALRLAEAYAGAPCKHVVVGGSKARGSTFFGKGTVKSVQAQCQPLEPDKVFVNAELNGVQQRNLEAAWGFPVLDRVALIIEIFGQRASTREAKLQVELASLEYRASRLVRATNAATGERLGFGEGGDTEVVSARERGRSGGTSGGLGGGGGGGESEISLQRDRIAQRRKMLRRRLLEVRKTREVQRAARHRAGKPVVAVVGYTNAGKSSLIAALARREMGARDQLFATLDPQLRRVLLPSGLDAIFSDTVGFISHLPPQLVDAFQATLEEVRHADVLVHVLDAAAPNVLHQRRVVLQVLDSLGIVESKLQECLIEVWNKADLLEQDSAVQQLPAGCSGSAQLTGDQQSRLQRVHSMRSLVAALEEEDDPASGRPPRLFASATQRTGLAQLLLEVDRKVGVKFATQHLAYQAARFGPKLLSENVVGPAGRRQRSGRQWRSAGGSRVRVAVAGEGEPHAPWAHLLP